MRTLALYFVTTAAITGFALNSATAQIPWQENLRTAHAQAQAQGKLLLLHFYSDNCVWCDRLEAGSFQNPSVGAAITKRYVPVKVHGGKNPKLTEMFKVIEVSDRRDRHDRWQDAVPPGQSPRTRSLHRNAAPV